MLENHSHCVLGEEAHSPARGVAPKMVEAQRIAQLEDELASCRAQVGGGDTGCWRSHVGSPPPSLRRCPRNACVQAEAASIGAEQSCQVGRVGGAAMVGARTWLAEAETLPQHLLPLPQAMERRYSALIEVHAKLAADKERLEKEAEAAREVGGVGGWVGRSRRQLRANCPLAPSVPSPDDNKPLLTPPTTRWLRRRRRLRARRRTGCRWR